MSIDVCISTIDAGLENLVNRLPESLGVTYRVGLQTSVQRAHSTPLPAEWQTYADARDDIVLHHLHGTGLSKSRNDLIELSDAEMIMFADDDIDYILGFEARLREAYEQVGEADVIVFPYESPRPAKSKSDKLYKHNVVTAARVSSIEITARRAALIDTGIRFDERFGLGTNQPSGEEYIFIVDLIRAGKKAFNYPIALVRHFHEASGPSYYLTPDKIATKGAMFKRATSAPLSWLLILLFAMKKYPEYRRSVGFATVLKLMIGAPRP